MIPVPADQAHNAIANLVAFYATTIATYDQNLEAARKRIDEDTKIRRELERKNEDLLKQVDEQRREIATLKKENVDRVKKAYVDGFDSARIGLGSPGDR